MDRYCIGGQEFHSKNEITDKCREIVDNYIGKPISDDDMRFLIDLFEFHPNKTKLIGLKEVYVSLDRMGENHCFYIRYYNGKFDDISWTKCVAHIPFNEDKQVERKMPFGKYKGESLYDILEKDKQYLEWLSGAKILNRELLIKVNQILRYGFIPLNEVALGFDIKAMKEKLKLNTPTNVE